MQYYSTNHQAPNVPLRTAILHSEAPDGGLYLPATLPILPSAFFKNIAEMSLTDISYFVANSLFASDISSATIKRIGEETFNFQVPLVQVEPGIYALELFHGPTLSVKDFSARFLARLLTASNPDFKNGLNVIVATTGNSGSAVANGFHGVEGVNVYALFPASTPHSISNQISCLKGNVRAMKVNGSIDQCRALVKEALSDTGLNEKVKFTCANSVNIGRVLPQSIAYFHAWARLLERAPKVDKAYVSVPCGNAGNLLAGYLAMQMGLPISGLIAACNQNAAFMRYLESGPETLRAQSQRTMAYALDTCCPANIPRFQELCKGQLADVRQKIQGAMCTDAEIEATIRDVYQRTGYIMGPHTAVGYKCLKDKLPAGASGIFLATAHPAKSAGDVSRILGIEIELPRQLQRFSTSKGREKQLAPTFPALRRFILQNQ